MTPARASSAPRLGSLCTGYGGLDLAAKAVFGARPAWFADNDPDAVRVLKHHHRRVPNLGDITGLDFADRRRCRASTSSRPGGRAKTSPSPDAARA